MPLLPQLITAGSQLAGNLLGIGANAIQNRKSQSYAKDMYQQQYQDNIAFWNMQNEYNHPSAQMKRLQEAGLNPMLVYGQSSGGAAGQATPIKTPDVQSAQFRTPDFDGIKSSGLAWMNAMYDFDIKQAQIDNLRADNTVKLEEAVLKATQSSRGKFDLGLESELRDISAEARKQSLRNLKSSNKVMLDENERKALMNSASLQEAAERILNSRQQRAHSKQQMKQSKQAIKNMRNDNRLKELDIELRQMGINPNDPMFMRIFGRLLEQWTDKKVFNWFN